LGHGIQTYGILIFAFIILPISELFFKADKFNIPKEDESENLNSKFYDWMLYIMVPIQYFIFGLFLYRISNPNLETFEKIGIISAFGISCGILGINLAHELGHRLTKADQNLSKLLLLSSQYLHFFIEHNRGHHKHVSTDEDSASAKLGENIYSFYFRTIIGSYISAWKIENESLRRKNIPVISWNNQMIRFQMYQLIILIGIILIFGFQVWLYYMCSAFIGIVLLETVNYIQHYGLRRTKIDDEYERVSPIHSWNSDYPLGRIFLFELSRHSDHHHVATRKYQILRTIDSSPQMPTGYPGMMLVALIPPIWFKMMHNRIENLEN
jgi:alkane 1-monooxygenase